MPTSPRARWFLLSGALNSAGSAIFLLVVTSVTASSVAGRGGTLTAAYLILQGVGAIAGTAVAPRFIASHGAVSVQWIAMLVRALFMGLLTLLSWNMDALVVALIVLAPLVGVSMGVRLVANALVTTTVIRDEASGALSRRQVVRAPAYAIGALAGGLVVDIDRPDLGFLVIGLLSLPALMWAWRWRGFVVGAAAGSGRATSVTPRVLWQGFRVSPESRRLLVLIVTSSIAILPIVSMIVPLVDDLGEPRLLQGAGLLLAAGSVGGSGAWFLRAALRRGRVRGDLALASAALIICGGAVMGIAFGGVIPSAPEELAVWAVLAVIFGAAKSLMASAQTAASLTCLGVGSHASAVARVTMARSIFLPVGLLLWGLSIDLVGSGRLVLAAGLVGLIVGTVLLSGPRLHRTARAS